MHRQKAATAKRIVAWGMGAALYFAVLVFAGNLAAGPQPETGAAGAVEAASVNAQQAVEAGGDAAAALINDTIEATDAGERPLVTVAIAAAGLFVAGVTWLVAIGRRRLAGRQRARRTPAGVRRITIPT